eukprot:scaffold647935_cov46-Prasinocladus_malaysianus.AAC.1
MLMADLAAVELLKATGREHIIRGCTAVAGLSLGEWAALVFARAISFDDALRCIKVRAEAMGMAAKSGASQSMISCTGLDVKEVERICKRVTSSNNNTTCQVAVEGAFHTALMAPAAQALKAVMATVTINDPKIPVISNVNGEPMKTADDIRRLMPRQICESVQWEACMGRMKSGNWTRLFEVGPGGQLKQICNKIDRDLAENM